MIISIIHILLFHDHSVKQTVSSLLAMKGDFALLVS